MKNIVASSMEIAADVRCNYCKRLPDYADLFRKYDFYDLFPLDGGGYFIFMDCLGTLDDLEITRNILSGQALKRWGTLGQLDYKAAVTWEQAELAMWIQRLYILPCMSRAYWLSRDDSYKQAAMMHLKDWATNNPYPATPRDYLLTERRKFEAQGRLGDQFMRSWFDFQPAARVVFICWSLYFLLE